MLFCFIMGSWVVQGNNLRRLSLLPYNIDLQTMILSDLLVFNSNGFLLKRHSIFYSFENLSSDRSMEHTVFLYRNLDFSPFV